MGTSPRGVAAAPLPRQRRLAKPAIVVEGVVKRFGATTALGGVSLRVEPGDLRLPARPQRLRQDDAAAHHRRLRDAGRAAASSSTASAVDRLPPNQRPVNTVFQRYALFPHKSVFENIAFPLALARSAGRASSGGAWPTHARSGAAARHRGASPGAALRRPGAASRAGPGADRPQPHVLLLDEPLAALDLKLRKAMQLELRRIQEELGTSFLYVTHDQEEALTMSDRIVSMNEGRIVQEGTPAEIYDRPASVFASGFIGEANLLRGTPARAATPRSSRSSTKRRSPSSGMWRRAARRSSSSEWLASIWSTRRLPSRSCANWSAAATRRASPAPPICSSR